MLIKVLQALHITLWCSVLIYTPQSHQHERQNQKALTRNLKYLRAFICDFTYFGPIAYILYYCCPFLPTCRELKPAGDGCSITVDIWSALLGSACFCHLTVDILNLSMVHSWVWKQTEECQDTQGLGKPYS